jgi:hypothetical protein
MFAAVVEGIDNAHAGRFDFLPEEVESFRRRVLLLANGPVRSFFKAA